MLLCYGFLPVYRKLNLFTLSDYLRRRYDERCAALYAVFMIIVMVLVQMVPGLYIGSRSLNVLLSPAPTDIVSAADASVAASDETIEIQRPTNSFGFYALGVSALAIVSGSYTILVD